jgi:hypothetical protein
MVKITDEKQGMEQQKKHPTGQDAFKNAIST